MDNFAKAIICGHKRMSFKNFFFEYFINIDKQNNNKTTKNTKTNAPPPFHTSVPDLKEKTKQKNPLNYSHHNNKKSAHCQDQMTSQGSLTQPAVPHHHHNMHPPPPPSNKGSRREAPTFLLRSKCLRMLTAFLMRQYRSSGRSGARPLAFSTRRILFPVT